MRRASGRRGVSLIELIIALGLSSMALFSLASLAGMAASQQVHAFKSSSVQMRTFTAFKVVEREMAEASYVLSPEQGGAALPLLEACANAQPAPGGWPPEAIDGTKPMRFFAFCLSGGTLYHHTLAGCPAAYTCGTNPAFAVGETARPVDASFLRPPGSGVVKVTLTATSYGISSVRDSSFAVTSAAGMNP